MPGRKILVRRSQFVPARPGWISAMLLKTVTPSGLRTDQELRSRANATNASAMVGAVGPLCSKFFPHV